MKVSETYLIKTRFGMNLLVKTEEGKWYQQVHQSLCHDGGGAAQWINIPDNAAQELIKQP